MARLKNWALRWKYRFIIWFHSKPDDLSRRVKVENILITHYQKKTSPTPEECMKLALQLGVPSDFGKRGAKK